MLELIKKIGTILLAIVITLIFGILYVIYMVAVSILPGKCDNCKKRSFFRYVIMQENTDITLLCTKCNIHRDLIKPGNK